MVRRSDGRSWDNARVRTSGSVGLAFGAGGGMAIGGGATVGNGVGGMGFGGGPSCWRSS